MSAGNLLKIWAVPVAPGRRVLDFATSYAEAVEMREAYRRAGWAAYIDGYPEY